MLELTLEQQMTTFIQKLRVVRKDQLFKFFSDWHPSDVKFAFDKLYLENRLFVQDGDILTAVHKLRISINHYDVYLDAIDILCYFTSDDIKWFEITDYPLELRFLTTDDVLYDVAVFNDFNWTAKYALIPRVRTAYLVGDRPDPYNHIAVARSIEVLQNVTPLDFTQYALIDRNGHVQFFDH